MGVWHLFVDESGKFSNPDDEVVAAGILIRDGAVGTANPELDASFGLVAPEIPVPLHTAHAFCPLFLAICRLLAHQRGGPRGCQLSDCGTLCQSAQRVDDLLAGDGDYQLVKRIVQGNGKVKIRTLEDLDWRLKELDRGLAKQFRQRQRVIFSGLNSLLANLRAAEVVRTAAGDTVSAAACCAGETVVAGIARNEPTYYADGNRYRNKLEALIIRTADVVGRHDPDFELMVTVSDRDLETQQSTASNPSWVPFTREHVREVQQQVRSRLKQPAATILLGDPVPWGPAMPLMLVFADFISFQSRHYVRSAPRNTLRNMERTLRDALGIGVRSGTPARSHLAAAGPAQDLIDARRPPPTEEDERTARTSLEQTGVRPWARGQALEWIGEEATP